MPKPPGVLLPLGPLTIIYLAVPLLIFFAGWLNPVFGLLAGVPLLFCGRYLVRAWPAETTFLRAGELLFLAAFSFGMTAFAGIGGYAPQGYDWAKHNAVLYDCVHLPWPVRLPDGAVQWPLDYYLAYYLPAAVIGKMAGYAAARAVLWIWSSLGLMLVGGWFARLSRLPFKVAVGIFFLFDGLDFFASLLVQLLGLPGKEGWTGFYPNEFWARIWQFSPHFLLLQMVPNQALAGWLSTGLFLSCPRPLRAGCLAFLLTCNLLWTPFGVVGLGLLAFFLAGRQNWKGRVRPPNAVFGLALPAAVLVLFYAAKASPDVASRFPKIPIVWFWRFQDAPYLERQSVLLLLLFVVFEFGILLWFIRKAFPRDSEEHRLAAACGAAFVCLLPVAVGYYNDLCMRASIAPWFVVAVLVARAVQSPRLSPRLRHWFWLVILVAVLTPVIEAGDQGWKLLTRHGNSLLEPREVSAVVHLPAGGFDFFGAQYVGSTNSFYWRHMAR